MLRGLKREDFLIEFAREIIEIHEENHPENDFLEMIVLDTVSDPFQQEEGSKKENIEVENRDLQIPELSFELIGQVLETENLL